MQINSPISRLPSYACPDRSAFFIKHIVAEAASIAKDLEEHLAKFEHHTISFDGWSSKSHAEIVGLNVPALPSSAGLAVSHASYLLV